ncbi:MAG: hypothetical protein MJ237_06745 [bacterium]|nr:hypothetical protein [bacterium]
MKMRVLFLAFLLTIASAYADIGQAEIKNQPAENPLVTVQNIDYEICTKLYKGADAEKLFYMTLCAIISNRFSIDEIQTANGYVIFTAAHRKYLATVAGVDKNNAVLKITPCNNVYYFQPGIVTNMFKYIDLNINNSFKS